MSRTHLLPADTMHGAKAATVTFRSFLVTHAMLILSQPLFIGLFLSGGDETKLHVHEIVGSAVGATGLFLLIAGVFVWRLARWPARTVLWCALLLVLEIVQLTMGYDRHLGVHVPLGVGLAVGVCFLYAWSFKPRVSDRRTDRQPNACTASAATPASRSSATIDKNVG